MFAKCLGHTSLRHFIQAHEQPKKQTLRILDYIKAAEAIDDKELKRSLKQQLYSFTPSVFIPKGAKRKYENIHFWTGLMQLDFDKLDGEADAIDLKNHVFRSYEHIVCAYLSPSRKGVKALMKIKVPRNKEHYKAIHKTVMAEMEQYDCFDHATTNAMLPLFLSVDQNILYRDYERCHTWTDEDWEQPEYIELNDEPTHFNVPFGRDESDYSKTVRIFTNKIQGIISDGHPQLRSGCLILGSRVGAGYISQSEAIAMARSLIGNNSYLQKDLENYKRTAEWAINEGMKSPKYY